MNILVTGAAGFIGFSTAKSLLSEGHKVLGVDNVNAYYDVSLKQARLRVLSSFRGFSFSQTDIKDFKALSDCVGEFKPEMILHLAAQAGVRYSLENPSAYIDANLVGFANILELSRSIKVSHLVYASTSSVYGANTEQPFSTSDVVDHPLTLYAATKKANELMAHSYSHLFDIPTTGLRFFTVYGPWGRPDMALFKFTEKILAGDPIEVFNYGNHTRDFTYIDDIVRGIQKVLMVIPERDASWDSYNLKPGRSAAPFKIYNIGSNNPQKLTAYIDVLERKLGKKAERLLLPLQLGDVPDTYADVSDLIEDVGYKPDTSIEDGIGRFVDWYLDFYGK